jgi:hypothetical protein
MRNQRHHSTPRSDCEQGRVDETPDQILARLQRHAESMRRAAAPRAPGARTEAQVVHWGGDRAADLIPREVVRGPRFGLVLRTIAGQTVAVLSCVLALVVSINLSVVAALVVVGALTVAGAIATMRRVPFSGWCTLGLAIGWVLGRFS